MELIIKIIGVAGVLLFLYLANVLLRGDTK